MFCKLAFGTSRVAQEHAGGALKCMTTRARPRRESHARHGDYTSDLRIVGSVPEDRKRGMISNGLRHILLLRAFGRLNAVIARPTLVLRVETGREAWTTDFAVHRLIVDKASIEL